MGKGAVVIAGPTASGKSALALRVAERLGGTIVNADAMQVYRELSVLTARPTPEEEARVPHRLYGYRAARDSHTVALWLADVAAVLDDLARADRTPVIVGGTGLYLTALTQGLSEIPPVPDEVRARWRAAAALRGTAALHADLAARDAETAARLHPSDTQRIIRALEVLDATGRSITAFQRARGEPVLAPDRIAAALVVAPERADLHARIAARFERMVASGGIEEARAFSDLGLDPALPAMKAIGVPEMIAAATGARPLAAAVADAVTATRRYAKRQETWFRNQMPGWRRVPPDHFVAAADALAQQMENGG